MTGAKEARVSGVPAKLLRAKLFAANALAAYIGYASTKNVKMPLKTRTVLLTVSHMHMHAMGCLCEGGAMSSKFGCWMTRRYSFPENAWTAKLDQGQLINRYVLK
jgi:hypothetical protein